MIDCWRDVLKKWECCHPHIEKISDVKATFINEQRVLTSVTYETSSKHIRSKMIIPCTGCLYKSIERLVELVYRKDEEDHDNA